MLELLRRVYTAFNPPVVEKDKDGVIKFGILGAAKIAPLTLILSARSHPRVVVQAIAARDRARAEAFAKTHGIPEVRDTYQEVIDDPHLDAILIPLPNSLHYEWAVRAIRAGKHVLLEKPSVSTAAEAEILFNLPELQQPNAPVLLEAVHNRFHPSFHKFLSFIDDRSAIEHIYTDSMVPWIMTSKNNIEFDYAMGGGSMMALGTYNFGIIRTVLGEEPDECLKCETSVFGDRVHDKCDYDFHATFRFPGGAIAEATTSLRGPLWWKPSESRVTMREIIVEDPELLPGQEKVRQRTVTLHGSMHAIVWHRIDVEDKYTIRDHTNGIEVKSWTETASHKAYSFADLGGEFTGLPGEDWWMSYRYQLEAFGDRVGGRATPYWVTGQDSIKQMKMLDMAYEKSGLGLRPTSEFR